MSQLRELQKYWQCYLLQNEPSLLAAQIIQPPTGEIIDRLAIYSDGYFLRLLEVMEKTFPRLKTVVGEEKFVELCSDYIDAHPSHYYSVDQFGREFSHFIQKKVELVYSEIARLEWELSEAIDAPNVALLSKEELMVIPQQNWGKIVFQLHPSFVMLNFRTNAPLIVQALAQGKIAPTGITTNQIETWRIWRKELQILFCALTPIDAIFLKALQQEYPFGDICEMLCEHMAEDDVVNYAIQQLLRWLEQGLLTTIKYKGKI